MNETENILIPHSRSKLLKILAASIIFVGIGAWILVAQPDISNPILNAPLFKTTLGIICIVFFLICGLVSIKKLVKNGPGIIIGREGITDHSGGIPTGFISWKEISGTDLASVYSQKFLVLVLKNPEEYIQRQTSALKRKLMEMNWKNYGSPVNISANSLNYSLAELKELIDRRLAACKTT